MKNSIKKILIGIASTMLIGCSVNDGNSSNKQSSDSNSSETLSSDSSFNTPSSEEITSESSSPYSSSSSETFHSSSQEDADDEDTYWVSDTYPYYSSPSVRFALSLEGGWNLGNSLDAHTDKVDSTHDYFDYQSLVASGRSEWETETCYGNPKVNLSLLQKVKEAGFTTIRIPVSWHQHCTISNNYKITEYWMNRVKTVVDQALGLGFKVILNTHHDIDPQFIYPDYNHINNSIKYIESIWEQISNVFGDYDKDKLVYEGCNEPRLTKNDDDFNTDLNTYEVADCINRINQAFVNKIRSSSKPNEQKRYLMVKGYADSWFPITQQNDYFKIPNDPINHILISTHLYYPSEFCFFGTGGFDTTYGSEHENHMRWVFKQLYEKYTRNGIGVVIGEWGSVATNSNLSERIKHANYYVEESIKRHIAPIYWDNGISSEAFALFNRNNNTNAYPSITDAINNHWNNQKNTYAINYYVGSSLLTSEYVREEKTIVGPSIKWGYGYDDLYLDPSLSQHFDKNTKITNNLSLYLSNYGVRPTNTKDADNDWGPIDSQYISAHDGGWYYFGKGRGKPENESYKVQINFDLPLLNNDTNYTISFDYTIACSGVSCLIYNDATSSSITSTTPLSGDNSWHHIALGFSSSNTTYGETRLTINLASVPSTVNNIGLVITNMAIEKT